MAILHTGFPVLHSIVFFTQGALGSEQSVPALHARHLPALQTPDAPPHGVPSARGVAATQEGPPSTHTYEPVWQSLGWHGAPATQLPAAASGIHIPESMAAIAESVAVAS